MRTFAYILVGLLLPRHVRIVDGHLDSDVQLRERDFDAELDVRLDDGDMLVESRVRLRNEVGLHSNAVDLDAIVLQHLHDPPSAFALRARRLQVVVVVVQLGTWVDLGRDLECMLDEVLTEHVVEDGLAIGAILLEGFVDNVPGVASALPVAGYVRDVRRYDITQGVRRPVLGLDPRCQLAVPNEGVASEKDARFLGY